MNNINVLLEKISLALSYIIQNQDKFSDYQALQIKELYPDWHTDVSYSVGQIVRYNSELYRVAQAHTSQADWIPDATTSLFTKISFNEDGVENWKQPTGAHDCYNIGDIVMHNENKWESLINGNTTEPTEANSLYWKLLEN